MDGQKALIFIPYLYFLPLILSHLAGGGGDCPPSKTFSILPGTKKDQLLIFLTSPTNSVTCIEVKFGITPCRGQARVLRVLNLWSDYTKGFTIYSHFFYNNNAFVKTTATFSVCFFRKNVVKALRLTSVRGRTRKSVEGLQYGSSFTGVDAA